MEKQISVTNQRFRKLVDEQRITREKLANILECDTSLITKYYNGDREIPVKNIIKIAKYFNVSADYLLGLSDAKTDDKDLQFVCDYTGLSAETIDKLREYCLPDFTYPDDFEPFEEDRILDEKFEIERSKKERKIIDSFILSPAFDELVMHGSQVQYINETILSYLAIYFDDYEYFMKLQKEGNSIEDIKLFLKEFENDAIHDAFIDRIDAYTFKFQKSILKYTDNLFVFNECFNSDLSVVFDWMKFIIWKFATEENSSIDTLRKNIEECKPEDYIERLSEWKKIYEKLKSR